MNWNKREYDGGTWAVMSSPWGFYSKAKLLCSDGKLRMTVRLSETADTFFSVPCAVQVNGKTVAGYMTVNGDSEGLGTLEFHQYYYGKNGGLLPKWPTTLERLELLDKYQQEQQV